MLPAPCPPTPLKSWVWNQAEPATAWPGAALGLLLQTRGVSFVFFSFSRPTGPTVVGVVECGFSKLFGVVWVCLPVAPTPIPPTQASPSLSLPADEWWL